jgi:hypothetical protein
MHYETVHESARSAAMLSMNGFTLGFFFPKQDFVRPVEDTAPADRKEAQPKTLASTLSSDDAGDRPAPLSLYAHRFF